MTANPDARRAEHPRPFGAAATETAVVVMDGVRVTFPRRTDAVLTGVSLRLQPGEQVVVLGPSGAGKSTLLQTLTGVVPHSVVAELDGTVSIDGVDTATTPVVELSRRVGVLAQDPSAAMCLPVVEQELSLPLENRGVDPRLISARIDGALDAVGASALRGRQTGQLSGGEGQRVSLAACLISEPAVVLLDEPTSMLDASGIASVRAAIDSAVKQYGPAVVLVEHRLDEYAGGLGAAGLPGRAIVLDSSGRVIADGSTVEVLSRAAAELHAAGCWLPLDTELDAVFGAGGGLGSAAVRAGLLGLSEVGGGDFDTGGSRGEPSYSISGEAGDIVLAAAGVSVSREAAVPRARRRRRLLPVRTTVAGTPDAVVRSGNSWDAHPAVETEGAPGALLRGVEFELRGGEIVAVLGANGIGKSSLLLTLAGLLPPAAGEVLGARPGVIFQNPEHQFVAETVRGEVGHGLPSGSDARVEALLVQHRLDHLAEQSPYRLSGGEKRRLSVAAMLAHDRPSLLADEPTFGLDRRATIATIQAFRAAAAEGCGIVFSSHDLRTVATLAHRAVVIGEGRVLADGPVFEVLRDRGLLERAGLTVPPLVAWLLANVEGEASIRRVLDALDASVSAESPSRPREQESA